MIIFSVPFVLNYFRLLEVNRLFLSWAPPILITGTMIVDMIALHTVSVSTHDGLRFYLLATCCIPYLLFERKNPLLLVSGIAPGFLIILFCDYILEQAGVGTSAMDFIPVGYGMTPVRTFVSYFMISASCFSLKVMMENSDSRNQNLVDELEKKNRFIQEQATNEVHQLNDQLRKNLEQLSEREFILNQSQRIAKIGSWEYRIEDSFLFWSEEMYNIFGLDRNFPVTPQNLSNALGEEGSRSISNATVNLLKTGRPYDLTIRTRTPLGYQKWFRVYAFPIEEDGNVIGVRGISHDITFFKEAEDKLRSSEAKFSAAFENNPDFIMIVRESDLLVVDVNQRISSVLGFTKEEVIGRSAKFMDLFSNDDERQTFINNYNEKGYTEHECPWKRKDGRIIQVRVTALRVIIENVYYRMSVVQDITEGKAAEEKFIKAFDLSPDLLLIFRESDLVLVEANRKLEEVSGYTREEVIGFNAQQKGLQLWVNPEEREIFFKEYYLTGTAFREAEIMGKTKGTFPATVSAQRIVLSNRNHIIIIVRDITEQRVANKKLLVSQANLNATINNTEILIWSVDRQFRLITYNIPFYEYMKKRYGIEIKPGSRILGEMDSSEAHVLKSKWSENYKRALAGEMVILEENRFGIDFQYSLSPIIENNQIIGVSIFADNVTERKSRDRELLEANKKIGELKLMALRSVMSPHFIFNVLNSIQFFIIRNDRLNAINYLSTFSKLIRSVLTHSVDNKIKLTDEIELLKNYVQLEMTRFENKFNFILNVSPDVDLDGIEIPSLLIQPYVENAILHGLYNKQEEGTLIINIKEVSDSVIFEIEDDGIGRVAALKLKEQNFPMHKSMGIKLTEERLKLVNQQYKAVFEIEDLMNDDGACGTRVRIQIAL